MSVETQQRGGSGWLLILLVVAAAIVALLGIWKVWYHYQTIGIGYQLAEETVRHRRLFAENRRLRLEMESLERDTLLRLGEEGLPRMKFPEPTDTVRVLPPRAMGESGAVGPAVEPPAEEERDTPELREEREPPEPRAWPEDGPTAADDRGDSRPNDVRPDERARERS